ncbi:glucan phosphoethanolaminetransferase (alkaline phosphatase superfamily) [Chitinophaga terrae (ex Kim and Jung 2007)]|uniref:hypothetical protein n=1 Tax=Chitinophaga terrae (ex Kim and Jung 2007) TaxID=408074 RepID=UPI00278B693D|nr:hypothetical protein [Chitinophaga terrae (ex Kim and Jung 2007)]MDQ0105043.1 glucan phosphoethanolaminetransferase (alkaline phosphatase superfamily) [Chitinophaga terrae (ex Kim and Jung 2007)]
MSVLAKVGVVYMDVEVNSESFMEVIEVISVYYFYSKLFYFAPFYFVLSVAFTLYLSHNKEISFKNIAIVHIVVSLLIFLVLWFGFGNGFGFIANPLLGLLLAGFLIYLLALLSRKPLISHKGTAGKEK